MKIKSVVAIPLALLSSPLGFFYSLLFSDIKIVAFTTSLLVSLAAFSMQPYETMDLTRYYRAYDVLKNISIDNLSDYFSFNLFIYYIIKFFADAGVKKEFIPFTFTFFSYILIFISFIKSVGTVRHGLFIKLLIVYLVLCTSLFFGSASGLRNGLSSSLAIFALVISTKKNAIANSYFLFIIACLIHPFAILLILCFVFSRVVKSNHIYNALLIAGLFLSFIDTSMYIQYMVEVMFPPTLSAYIITEFITSDVAGFAAEKTFINIVIFYSSIGIMLVSSILLLAGMERKCGLTKFALILLSISLAFYSYPIFFERYSNIVFILVGIITAKNYSDGCGGYKDRRYSFVVAIFWLSLLLNSAFQFYRYRYIFLDDIYYLLKPTVVVFFDSVNINNLRLL